MATEEWEEELDYSTVTEEHEEDEDEEVEEESEEINWDDEDLG
ncbi:MAG TPA: hypothetical protein VLJ21_00725 [Candidatus Binatia bacterium]|nr:hypothetical protein [Candidatus Binatia bacterium]